MPTIADTLTDTQSAALAALPTRRESQAKRCFALAKGIKDQTQAPTLIWKGNTDRERNA